jgi:hypothetical protein
MAVINDIFVRFPSASPFMERILFCLGRLFDVGGSGRDEVTLIARYQFARRLCLDQAEMVSELEVFEGFPADRSNFPLADFLIDLPIDDEGARHLVMPINTRDDLFRALRQILAGICCRHPYVLRVLGWNIAFQTATPGESTESGASSSTSKWKVHILTQKAPELSREVYEGWSKDEQQGFVLTAASGLAWIHNCGILHNHLSSATSYRCRGTEAQICDFGLLSENAGFDQDTEDFTQLFAAWGGFTPVVSREVEPYPPPKEGESAVRETKPLSFEEYVDKHDPPESEPTRLAKPVSVTFPFDLFFHLVGSKLLWEPSGEPLDVPEALGKLTRGLDESELELFKRAVDRAIAGRGFLRRSDFGRWTKGPKP